MVPTGCASAAAISACATAQHPFVPQVLPACGLQDSRNEEQNHYPKSSPNTMCPPLTLGGNHGPGHFYLAENRTFLLCVDTRSRRLQLNSRLTRADRTSRFLPVPHELRPLMRIGVNPYNF